MYQQIFRRKSFHKFKNTVPLTSDEVNSINDFIKTIKPLEQNIDYEINIVPAEQTTSSVNAEYCILFYSEKKDGYLRNIGYLGEQIDLFLVSKNIGTLWYGLAKTNEKKIHNLDYVIMMAISKVVPSEFRNKESKVTRKSLDKIWEGSLLNIAKVVSLSPSAVNSQPWFVEVKEGTLVVYQKKPKLGFIPFPLLGDYNRIDIGIFLYILELCLHEEGYSYKRTVFVDNVMFSGMTKVAEYSIL